MTPPPEVLQVVTFCQMIEPMKSRPRSTQPRLMSAWMAAILYLP